MADIIERLQAHFGDRYKVERELGAGGMATVYLAHDLKHDRRVAVKVLHEDLGTTIGADRFEREIKLAAKLQHPHILGLYDSGAADGLLFYVMPFVKGESLRDKLDREGQLGIDEALQIVLEVAGALGHAHKLDIIHRDIKPENIMLSEGHALVADFGIAKAAAEGGEQQKLTQTGMALGTPVYMAPEQAMGEVVGPQADLYSLGCMLYELLAGEPPFMGKSAQALLAKHAMESVPSICVVRPTVPPEVEDAIFAAMAKVPADRPKTAEDFAEMLGMSIGSTATMRASIRATATRRAATRAYAVVEAPIPWYRKPLVLAGGGIGIVAAVVVFLMAPWRSGITPVVGGLPANQVAVLYFEDLSPGGELAYLADGLTEGLIGTLAQVQGIGVVSRNGVEPYRTSTLAPDSIARALQAGTLVRGSVERRGDRLAVNVSLVDGNSGAPFQRAGFERPFDDVLGASTALAEEVARLIRSRLGEEVRFREQRLGTSNPEAWSLVQRAEQVRHRAEAAAAQGDSATQNREFAVADSLLTLAEQLDGNWSEPPEQRAFLAYRQSRLSGRDQFLIRRWVDAGLPHVNRALALDPNSSDAMELRGNLRYWSYLMGLEPDAARAQALLDSAQADLEAATRLNPVQAGAWSSLSHLYNYTKSAVDVNMAARRALESDAYLENADVVLGRLFISSYDLAQFVDADQWCAETRRRFPGTYPAPRCELFMQTTRARPQPDVDRAWRLADSVAEMAGNRRPYFELNSRMLVAAVLARAGLQDSAKAVVQRSLGDAELNPTRDLALFGAFALAQMNDVDGAVQLLTLYFQANEQARAGMAEDPGWWFRGIAETPQFRQLVGTR